MLTEFKMIDLFHPLPSLEDMTDLLGLGVISKIKNTSLLCYNHRPLHSDMDRNECLGVYHRGPTFLGQFVTIPVVIQVTNRCQMKDMNKIFLKIPYRLL